MGITGLLPFVKNSCRSANIKDFAGSTVAIDAYSWLHKGAFSCAEKLAKGEKTDGYVFYCIKLLNMLIDAGVTPVMVFDGCNLASKAVTEKKRRENREKSRQRGKELLCEGKIKEARECFQRCVDVTPEMAKEVIEACRKKSVDCIVAPYEADAQLAYLNKMDLAQLIITEDSDLILFGCTKILFKMDAGGGGMLFEKENLPKSFGANASKFSFEKFRYMCILSGCDYLPSLPGIGLAKSCKFLSLTVISDLPILLSKLPSYLKMPKLVVTDEYKDSFIKANNTFLHQLAFCPKQKCLVPLNPYPEGVSAEDMEYAGKYLDPDLAYELAMGNINVKTLKEFVSDSFTSSPNYNEDTSVIWGSGRALSNSNASTKRETAFKFNAPSKLSTSAQKRKVIDLEEENESPTNYDEDLFSQYSATKPKKTKTYDPFEEEPIPSSSTSDYSSDHPVDSSISSSPTLENSPSLSKHPFKKVVKSRFFNPSSSQSSIDISLSNASTPSSGYVSKSEDFLSCSDVSDLAPATPITEQDKANELEEPKSNNKENIINRFAKKKPSDTAQKSKSEDHNLITSTPKQESISLLDIFNSESSSTTSTLSSGQSAVKILSPTVLNSATKIKPKSLFSKKEAAKKLTDSKISDFKFKEESSSETDASTSAGSSKNTHDESFDTTPEQKTVTKSPLKEISPYFLNSPEKASSLDEPKTIITIDSDTEDLDLPKGKNNINCDNKVPEKASLKKSNLISGKPKCRTIGLSKKRKSNGTIPRKETLLNFNFIRHSGTAKSG